MKKFKKKKQRFSINRKTVVCLFSLIIGSVIGALLCTHQNLPLLISIGNDNFLISGLKITVFIGILAFTLFGVFVIPFVLAFLGCTLSYLLINDFSVLLLFRIAFIVPLWVQLCCITADLSASFCGVEFLKTDSERANKNLLVKFFIALLFCAISVTLFSIL